MPGRFHRADLLTDGRVDMLLVLVGSWSDNDDDDDTVSCLPLG